jgi:PAS domain S-box-containing protein
MTEGSMLTPAPHDSRTSDAGALSLLREALAERDAIVASLQRELEETNQGVVALYAELDVQAEQLRLASQRSESKFQTIYSQALNGIALLDDGGRIVDGNPALARLLTLVDESVIGRRLADYVPAEFVPRVEAFCSPVASYLHAQEVPLKRPDGSLAYAEWNVSAQIEPGITMVVGTDVSQRVELERMRQHWLERERAARGNAEQGSRLKDDFIAVLAHELRTPLNAIMGWTQVLRKRGGTAEAMRGVLAIERNCTTQARMISDLLDMSRLNMGKLAMSFDWLDPLHEVVTALETMKEAIDQKAIVVSVESGDRYRLIHADASRLQQVVWNLVGNAIKFSSHGSRVVVELAERETGLSIRIKDSGQGIDPAFLPFVFERFAQSDVASNRHRGGLGLGLAIVKQIVEAHGGTISVHSEGPGLGTLFEVWLPIGWLVSAESSAASRQTATSAESLDGDDVLAGARLLIVDDDQDALAMLRIILTDRGAVVTAAANAEDALDLIAVDPPDLIVSDIGMPGTDGHEFLRRLRAAERQALASSPQARRIPAIALTSFTRDADRVHAVEAGYDAHCSKPVQPMALVRQIAQLLAPPAAT